MVYSSRSSLFEDNPERDKALEQQAELKRRAATGKILKFFEDKVGAHAVTHSTCSSGPPTKIQVVSVDSGIVVNHRGCEIKVSSTDPRDLETQFREWCAAEMAHAKVFPRATPK